MGVIAFIIGLEAFSRGVHELRYRWSDYEFSTIAAPFQTKPRPHPARTRTYLSPHSRPGCRPVLKKLGRDIPNGHGPCYSNLPTFPARVIEEGSLPLLLAFRAAALHHKHE